MGSWYYIIINMQMDIFELMSRMKLLGILDTQFRKWKD